MQDRIMSISDMVQTDLNDMPPYVKTYDSYLNWCHTKYQNTLPQLPTETYDGYVGETVVVVDKGRWVVSCAACGSNYLVEKGAPHFLCASCQYQPGRRRHVHSNPNWVRLVWPENIEEIEQELLSQPGQRERSPYRDWEPHWSMHDLRHRSMLSWMKVENDPTATGLSISRTRLWAVGEVVSAANMILYINNPINNLAGRLGPPVQIEGSMEILHGRGFNYLGLPRGTTDQRPVSPQPGWARFNTSLSAIEYWNGNAWVTPEVNQLQDLPSNLPKVDNNVIHGQNIAWPTGYTPPNGSAQRVVLGHGLGKPPVGFQMYLVRKGSGSIYRYDAGNEIMIPHAYNISVSAGNVGYWFKVSSPENTTCVVSFFINTLAIPIMNRDRNTVHEATALNFDFRIKIWG